MIPRSLSRAARRFARLFRSGGAEIVYSGRYVMDLPATPADPQRGERILTFLHSEGLIRRGDLHWPQPAQARDLALVHTDDYLDALVQPGALLRVVGVELSQADEDRFLTLQRTMVGGTLLATRLALSRRRPAINLGGGLHHAHADRGGGFCAFNDAAIAIAQAREAGFSQPVLVIDLDLHDGDGTRSIFAGDPTVHTFSIHNRAWDESEGAVASTAIALGPGVEDDEYLGVLERRLPPVIREVEPGLVLYLAGCDPAASDALGDWRISDEGMLARDRRVVAEVRKGAGRVPLVVLLAGGYGTGAWRYSARFFSWLLTGKSALEPPSTEDLVLTRYRHLRSLFTPAELTTAPNGDDWGLTEEDLMMGAVPKRTRFLGYYSTHGVEIALERLGFLARLREMGYPRPVLDFQLDHPAGQTVRIFGDASQQELLVELRARVDRRTLPDRALLFVEWLMLQNPLSEFKAHRPALPGQKHPGLGLLRDVVSMLVLVCERLELDGLAFVPSHFHLAAQSRKHLRFLRPEDAGRFRALCRALEGLPLSAATRALHEGRVYDAASGETVRWQPALMVLPVSERLRQSTAHEAYEEAARKAADALDLRLRPAPDPDDDAHR